MDLKMKTIETCKFPSLFWTDRDEAFKEAKRLGVEVCEIIYVQEWNGEIETNRLGWGLYDEKLLGTKDFINVHF